MRFEIMTPDNPKRSAVEAMVRDVFSAEYDARIDAFPNRMIAVLDEDGRPLCAAGLRDAATGFFSEQYLDVPMERAIAAVTGKPVMRGSILELGSVAADRPGALLILLRGFANLGLDDGYRWGVFTATERLCRMAGRLGIVLHDLGPALRHRIADPANWGRYYDSHPRVCAVEGMPAEAQLEVSRMPCSAGTSVIGTEVVQ